MEKTIDKLIKENWKPLNMGAGTCKIYGRGEDRIIYNPKNDSIILEYKVHKVDICKGGNSNGK